MNTLAQQLCSDHNVSFSQTYRYQFVVSPEPLDLPGFVSGTCGAFYVSSGEALRRVLLQDRNGVCFGVCLGVAVDHAGQLPEEHFARDFDSTSATALDDFEDYLAILSGRYALITHLAGQTCFHCDPVGMIGAVYASETRRIASSTFLCINRPVEWHPAYDRAEVEAGEGSYGFSHTCDAHVVRMNANHRMTLESFETKRFWPKPDDAFTAPAAQYGAIYDEMIAAGQKVIARMTTLAPTSLPLSGGNDSRILMALAGKETLKDFTQIFSHINTYANRRDAHVAATLCAAKDVPFEVHDRKKVKVERYIRRLAGRRYRIGSGTLTTIPKEIDNGLFLEVVADAIVMRGHQTNIMRGQYLTTANPSDWKNARWQIRMMQLVGNGRFTGDVAKRFASDFQACYDDLPMNARDRSADFIFFETLVPAALGTLFPGQDRAFYLSPFNSRRLVQLSMQPDTTYRLSNATTNDLLLRADPSLAALPFASELPADLAEKSDALIKRDDRLRAGLERYPNVYNGVAPLSVDDIAALD